MKQIKKNSPPESLIRHKKTESATYDNYPDKGDVRMGTYLEQRGVCCYCMEALTFGELTMKIEHNKSRHDYPEYQLEYWNLLGACLGNQGQPKNEQHCDTFKGQKRLSFNPADRNRVIQDLIFYNNDGTVGSANAEINRDLMEVLNLNVKKLVLARKYVLDGFKDILRPYNGRPPKETLTKWLNEWNGDENTDSLRPFSQVVVYWLRKRLAK